MATSDRNKIKRIGRELLTLQNPTNTFAVESLDEITHWKAFIPGPVGSPYEAGKFELDIVFVDYPLKHPDIKFTTAMYHPNIDKQGKICAAILKDWKPTQTMEQLLNALCDLLDRPDPEDPLDADIAHLYKTDYPKFKAEAEAHTKKYALSK
ncbi:MAG: ubiquitin-conjugating enzyme/RWD-like protein [Benniella sp.]|nr:MAG: ubiquitin-conjugating enzyme/RWD-like protein [Benniella sp.]